MRAKKYRARYGVTVKQVEALRDAQHGCCKICGTHDPDGLFVDHDHSHCSSETGCPDCVRGLLCRACNSAIGQFRDDPQLMMVAAEYVRTRGAYDAMEAKRTG